MRSRSDLASLSGRIADAARLPGPLADARSSHLASRHRAAALLSLASAAVAVALVLSSSAVAASGDAHRVAGAALAPVHVERPAAARHLEALADRLTRQLGGRSAGAYLDPATGQLVVTVVHAADAATVRAAGARPRLVRHTGRRLAQVKSRLDRAESVPGTAWSVDPVRNTVTVSVPTGQDDARTLAFLRGLARYGDLVRVERIAAAPRPQAFYGGQAIQGGSVRCSAGFNTVRGTVHYVLTAGHCTGASFLWTDGFQPVGTTTLSRFPQDDYGLIRVTARHALGPQPYIRSGAGLQRITRYSRVPVGSRVCKTGATSGTTCGVVQRYGVTVNYTEGRVYGLTETTVCTRGGDSGGGLFAGPSAQGIVSGATSGSCTEPGFRSYFQPVDEVLRTADLSLL